MFLSGSGQKKKIRETNMKKLMFIGAGIVLLLMVLLLGRKQDKMLSEGNDLDPVFFDGVAGIFGGYERINNSDTIDNRVFHNVSYKIKQFTFGFSGTVKTEVILVENWIFTVIKPNFMI